MSERDWNSPVEVLRAKVASLAVYIHVTEKHPGEMRSCPNGECMSAWAAVEQTRVETELGEAPLTPNSHPTCEKCGYVAFRPDPIAGRKQAWRCGRCHFVIARCKCAP